MSVPATSAVQKSGLDTGTLDLSGVVIHLMSPRMNSLLGPSVAAITIGNRIFVTESHFDGVVKGEAPELLAHELVHVDQWRREGRGGFVLRYLSEYLRNRVIGLDHRVAYRAISFEAAAFESSEAPDKDVL